MKVRQDGRIVSVAVIVAVGVNTDGRREVLGMDEAEAARLRWRRVADQLRPKVPKLAALMDEAEPDVLASMGFPARHRVRLHSTNPLERLDGEIERRTEVVGIVPDEAAITRLVGAILLERNDEWAVQRARYHAGKHRPDRR